MARKTSATAKVLKADGAGLFSMSLPASTTTTIHSKKMILENSDSEDSEDTDVDASVSKTKPVEGTPFKINEEFAKRFEHNKKREELQRLEEKYGVSNKRRKMDNGDSISEEEYKEDDDDDDSTSESEDELGELALGEIDAQFQATLAALRSKDPKVYDERTTFFTAPEDQMVEKEKKEKSMTLKQYHQKNLLEGFTGEEEEDARQPRTYVQEQEHLKRSVVDEMHAAAAGTGDADEEGDFLIRKSGPITDIKPRKVAFNPPPQELPANPEANPEAFLNSFLDTKAWLPRDVNGNAIELESDDSEEEQQAEDFEHAYNMRFEDPTLASRSTIISHARDVASKMSLRREDKSRRRKARDERQDRKLREIEEREVDKKRLRKLQIEEMEKKMKMVREAGGLVSSSDNEDEETGIGENEKKRLKLDREWQKFLEHGWEGDDEWEERMGKMFGENYYQKKEGNSKKVKKPTWEDDIDITDIVPDFVDNTVPVADQYTSIDEVSEDKDVGGNVTMEDVYAGTTSKPKLATKASRQTNRILRANIESYVDSKLPLSLPHGVPSTKRGGTSARFRYREVTPESYNLTSTDILFAADKHLNEYAGLKKLASFRDDSKKAKDRKRYNKGKSFKLREWRKEVFGKSDINWEELAKVPERRDGKDGEGMKRKVEIVESKKEQGDGGEERKKRRRKGKGSKDDAPAVTTE